MTEGAGISTVDCPARDGLRLHVRQVLPDRPAKALVIVVHGVIEHGGRYAELAAAMSREGLAVWIADLRGHGRSEGSRVWVESFDQYVDDLAVVVDQARATQPDAPLFLFGHSLGGLIVLKTSQVLRDSLAGVIVSAPAVSVAEGLFPWLRKLAGLGSRLFPRWRLAKLGCSKLSRDPQVIADFRADPLVFHGRIPTRTGAEILRESAAMQEQGAKISSPLLILQGTGDVVVSPQGVERFYGLAASGDKTLRTFPGLYHDLPREPERAEILAEIATWICRRC